MTTPHPYSEFIHRVQKPARYLGGEYGAKVKPWGSVEAKVCLAFPDIYDIGMSHLGFKILYKILNDDARTVAERAYAPWVDMEAELRARSLPLLTLESARPLVDFDVVGFSLQFELTYTNILTMLDLGRVPRRSSARGNDDPLVIAGGPTATHPEPLAPFIDAFVIGDGEEIAKTLALTWVELRAKGVSRKDRLEAIAKLRGVYVPTAYSTAVEPETGFVVVDAPLVSGAALPISRNLVADLNAFPFPDDGPVGGPEAIFDRMSIEIARGCTEGCRFCQAGMIYRPVRERDPEQVVETIVSAVKKSGYDEASLTSLSTADYSCIAPLIKKVTDRLAPERVSLGVSSLRAYGLEEPVLDDIARVRASGITFAPEAGSQRMRDVVNKNVTEEQLMTTAERIFSRNWSSMKLYFMIGLPTEEESDVREIVRVGGRARVVGKRMKRERKQSPPTVTVSVSTHVPKPHTPFQWCAMDNATTVREKQRWLIEEQRQHVGVDLRMHDSEGSWLEAVFSRGDRSLGDVLESAYEAGARFDSWEDQLKLPIWEAAFEKHGVEPARFLGTIPVTSRLPWTHIDVGLEDGFLLSEYRKALKNRLSLPCGKAAGMFIHHTNLAAANADERRLVCYDCGVACDLGAMRDERLVYLCKLGAEAPRPKMVPFKAQVDPDAPPVATPSQKRSPPPRIVQGEARRYRFGYTKVGPSALLSHLDLIRALPRSFRRVDLPLFYSSGFHPKPDMVFGPALSLGVASTFEIVDVKLTVDCDAAARVADLAERSPLGLDFFAGTALGPEDRAITRVIDVVRYAVAIPNTMLSARGGRAMIEERVARFSASESARVLRRIDGVGKWVDVKHYVRSLRVGHEDDTLALAKAGYVGDFTILGADVLSTNSGSTKISEVIEVLARADGSRDDEVVDGSFVFQAVRTMMGQATPDGGILSPFALDLLRVKKPASASVSEEAVAPAGE
ncbi:hypothetical protein BH09MYX1_BH09MYX1_15310 [soil metagenome]